MPETHGTSWLDVKVVDRHGAGPAARQGQSSDGTGTTDDLAGYLEDGTLTKAGIKISEVLTTDSGLTVNDWYGQVPRGTVNGSNRTFLLDYTLKNPYAVLQMGSIRMPSVQGVPGSLTGTQPVPNGEFAIARNFLTLARAPQPGERFYIEYFRGDPVPTATSVVLTITTAFSYPEKVGAAAGVSIYGSTFGFGGLPWIFEDDAYAKTTQSIDVSVSLLPIQLTSQLGILALNLYFFFTGGTTSFIANLDVYDAFLTVTYADESTEIYRPTSYVTPDNIAVAHMDESPPTYANDYAIDGSPDTFARLVATHWGALTSASPFILNGWALSGTTPPTPIAPAPLPVTSTGTDTTLPPNSTGGIVNTTGSGSTTITLPSVLGPPSAPVLSQVAGGTLGARTLYARITYTNATGETIASAESSLAVSANHLLKVTSPASAAGATGYIVYVGSATGAETKQNFVALPIGTDWTEPSVGFKVGGPVPPTVNTASPGSGWSTTVINTGTGTVSVVPPTGTTINGSTSPVTLLPSQAGLVVFDPSTNNYTVAVTCGTSGGGSGSGTPILGTDGTPLTDAATGEWLYPAA